MSLEIHRSSDRGQANYGWLQARYSFSFAQYWNPQRSGFGALLVLNDDRIAPGKGFPTHGHQDMEIITIPLAGRLRHQDSMGQEGVLNPGEVQVMSAGTGILHSEVNDSDNQELSLFQIWIKPKYLGRPPRYEQRGFERVLDQWQFLASGDGRQGSLEIGQDAVIAQAEFSPKQKMDWQPRTGFNLFAMVIQGQFELPTGEVLQQRDSLELIDQALSLVAGSEDGKLLVIEVPNS